VEKNFQIQVH